MAYTYTPYQQALPDTTLYERLKGSYTPAGLRQDPYQSSLFSQNTQDYYADPFAYTKKKFNFGPTLDDSLGNKADAVGLGGMFTPQASSGGSDSSGGPTRNYYQEIEDRFFNENRAMGIDETTARTLAEQQRFGIQSKNNQALVDNIINPLSSFGIAGLFSKIIGGTPTPIESGQRAPVVSASDTIARATREAEARAVAERQAAAAAEAARQAQAAQAAADAARNVQPVGTYTPTGNASDWSPVDSSGNISWSGSTYSPSAYSSLSDAFG